MKRESKERNFLEMIHSFWQRGYFLCVGLDPELEKIPCCVKSGNIGDILFEFCRHIIGATAEWASCFKPNIAFFERYGPQGVTALINVIADIHERYPAIPVILDAKRGDIGNTNAAYAAALFGVCGADAITVNPYLGIGSFTTFTSAYPSKCLFVLCRTSNPEAALIQDLPVHGYLEEGERVLEPLYAHVARQVQEQNAEGSFGVVVGATHSEELSLVRKVVGAMPILIPGVGAQGGNDLKAVVSAGRHKEVGAIIINASRSIIYAAADVGFGNAVADAARELHQSIQACLEEF